jgi:hypothetical protein
MTETETSPEKPYFNRDQVLAAFKKFVDRGIASPDDLPLDDPEVVSANAVLDSWGAEAQRRAEQNPASDANLEYSLSRSTVHVDAGFDDPDYLEEVANDWLANDLQEAEEAGLTAIAGRIKSKIDEINARLSG